MGYFGGLLGEGLGKIGGSLVGGAFGNRGEGENIGSQIGKWAGSYLPFKKGGMTIMPVERMAMRKGGMAQGDEYKKGGFVVSNNVPLTMDYMNRVISPPQRLFGNQRQV
jgi:hypothetical protein